MVSSAPRFAPSNLNCTPTTPPLSVAVAVTVTFADTVAPGAGAVSHTLGAPLTVLAVTVMVDDTPSSTGPPAVAGV